VNEQEHHKKAFEFYYGLGEGRSYKQVAEEHGVSLGAVKLWGRSFGWKRRVRERDGEIARALADQSLKDGVERSSRNRKIIEMGLVRVAQAIAEGKVKVTMADLDRLIRLEEFLREDLKESDGVTVIFNWTDEHGNPIKDSGETNHARTTIPDKKD
jgi:hypothetical protein